MGQSKQMQELKLAESMIRSRMGATRTQIDEYERAAMKELEGKVSKELNFDKARDKMNKANQAYREKESSLKQELYKKLAKLEKEMNDAGNAWRELQTQVRDKVAIRSAEITKKAADMRAHLSDETNNRVRDLYNSQLSPDLQRKVDEIPTLADLAAHVPQIGFDKR
jgi:hypothetical protein